MAQSTVSERPSVRHVTRRQLEERRQRIEKVLVERFGSLDAAREANEAWRLSEDEEQHVAELRGISFLLGEDLNEDD
ncbi:hypothetical protein I6B53_10505 [Schaalia sp. 19OD2882]|uniref:hypothetical protein n=1 Tax=Schaalia sp. 19OD2882 TaxID=2794089 RepID=UPI001C1EBDDD|nr:hypothetical protein [Schaalia sp. 19OD2882]QWW19492.1 hypothetical protein I6B53_10505 [Schaalia sp. 19OD2882]